MLGSLSLNCFLELIYVYLKFEQMTEGIEGDAYYSVLMHGIGGILVDVDTRLLIKLLKQEGDVCGNTVNEEVMDVEEHYGCCQEFILTLESSC